MLINLKNLMVSNKISNKDLSELLNLSEKSVYSKIAEKTDFTLEEIKKSINLYFHSMTFSIYLQVTNQHKEVKAWNTDR